ncbi:S-adenosyl-L-methionine-dependent methyltransferase, partial [Xylariales sp. PMI_506]
LQHEAWQKTLEKRLSLAPISHIQNVLNVGTGCGTWAIEFAEKHPFASVIGVDHSYMQDTLVPPNCELVLDDIGARHWGWDIPFDFIFTRGLGSCLTDSKHLVDQSYESLQPGGWLEIQSIDIEINFGDGRFDPILQEFSENILKASEYAKKPLKDITRYKSLMEKAGFQNIIEKRYKGGLHHFEAISTDLEGICLKLFMRHLNWSYKEVLVFCALVRASMQEPNGNYFPMYVVYGQKPSHA